MGNFRGDYLLGFQFQDFLLNFPYRLRINLHVRCQGSELLFRSAHRIDPARVEIHCLLGLLQLLKIVLQPFDLFLVRIHLGKDFLYLAVGRTF